MWDYGVYRKKVIITEDTIRQNIRLDDADGIDYLPDEEIFAELARMGYEKPSNKLTFYKAFFSAQWKFLIYTIVQCMCAKRTIWNEFSSSMASTVICLAIEMINAQVDDLSSYNTKYTSPALTQKVFANMRRIGKGFSGVETPLFVNMLVQQQVQDDAEVEDDEDTEALMIVKLKQRLRRLEKKRRTKFSGLKRLKKRMAESQAKAYNINLQHSKKVLSMQDTDEAEPAKVEEVLEVVTTAKLMTEVVTTTAPITTTAQVPKASAPRRRRGVIIQDPEETTTTLVIMHLEVQSKDTGKGILIEEPKPLKGQAHIDIDKAFARQLEAELNRKLVTEAHARKNMMIYLKKMARFKMSFFKERVEEEVIVQEKEIKEEGSKRKGKSLKHKIAKKQRIDEEAEELKIHLQIIAKDDDDVYTKATPLASKNFDREDLENLWKFVKEIFESIEPKNYSDDFLLNIFKIMFEKPNIKANEWRDQKGRYGLAKVKIWKLFESYGVHIISLTTTQMFMLVEKKYTLTHFTLEQMLNNVRLKVQEESKMSLELLRLVRRQLNEGYAPK
nr:hypothetical protein [Tanacetum cinerariifolium]